jgi:hypothetical protein
MLGGSCNPLPRASPDTRPGTAHRAWPDLLALTNEQPGWRELWSDPSRVGEEIVMTASRSRVRMMLGQ